MHDVVVDVINIWHMIPQPLQAFLMSKLIAFIWNAIKGLTNHWMSMLNDKHRQ
jgi:hypothetical protein